MKLGRDFNSQRIAQSEVADRRIAIDLMRVEALVVAVEGDRYDDLLVDRDGLDDGSDRSPIRCSHAAAYGARLPTPASCRCLICTEERGGCENPSPFSLKPQQNYLTCMPT